MQQPTPEVGASAALLALNDQGLMCVCKYIISLFYFSDCTKSRVYTGFHVVPGFDLMLEEKGFLRCRTSDGSKV